MITPAEQQQLAAMQQATRLKAAQMPPRNEATTVSHAGPWGEKFKMIHAKSGTGYLVGLCGERGGGKTQLGCELIRAQCRTKAARYCTAMSFFIELKASYGGNGNEAAVLEGYIEPALLVVDEFGKRGETEWSNQMLFHILDTRYAKLRDTLLIDNRTADEFERALGPSLASRMTETGGIIEARWPSFRGGAK